MPKSKYKILEEFPVNGPSREDFGDVIIVRKEILGPGTFLYIFPTTMYGEKEFVNNMGDVFTCLNSEEYQHPSGKIYTRDRTKYG